VAEIPGGWRVDYLEGGQPASAEHCAVIYCGTAFKLAELKIEARKPVKLSSLSEIRHPPVASVVLGFRRQDVTHPCSGFGVLIPGMEGYKILGSIFSSALFPNRAPAGHITLTSYVGGERAPELARKSPEELFALVRNDLRELLGVNGEPTFRHCAFYPLAIPQYNVGFGRYRELMTDAEARAPGLFLAGHYRDGVSLSDSILSGCRMAERAAKYVKDSPAPSQPEPKGAALTSA
jgi:oxygen-dependent protoporphyrinogen oxidase